MLLAHTTPLLCDVPPKQAPSCCSTCLSTSTSCWAPAAACVEMSPCCKTTENFRTRAVVRCCACCQAGQALLLHVLSLVSCVVVRTLILCLCNPCFAGINAHHRRMMVMSGNLGLSLACIVKVLVWLLATEAVHAAISPPVSYATSVGTNYVLCTDVVSIAAGNHHTCGVLKDQTVMCWGDNTYGQLGDGTTTSSRVPVVAPGLSNVRSISARGLHTCAVLWNGTARCWGSNGRGQLGDGTSTDRYLPVVVSGLNSVRSIFASLQHTCAVMEDNTASCWGSNDRGQLGDGTTVSSSLPLVVSGLSDVRAITAGYAHTCALSGPALNGVVHCWGDNSFGQLGDGSNSIWSHVPTVVSGLSNASMISAGWGHTCMVMDDHTARCWGYNSCGHLGDGTTTDSNIPVAVAGLSNVRSVSTGDVHTCELLDNGAAQCWGCNDLRELGDGTTTNSRVPVVVSGVGGARSISAGGWHTCVVFGNNTASCWGWDNYGQLGYGASSGDTVQPVLVSGCAPRNSSSNYTSDTCSGVVEVVGGAAHSCAVFKDGAARCWGSSYALGNGSSTVGRAVRVVVSGVSNVRNISATGGHTCAVLGDKTARCWGDNFRGLLGDGTRTDSSVPVVVSGLSNVSSISCGWSHTCAVLEDGTARCWGDSLYGELGDGTLMPSNVPVVVANLSNVRSIASGKEYTCAVLHDGTARCWGCNFAGQLGNGSVSHQRVPVMVSGLSNVRSISAAAGHTCVGLENGAARCWGDNSNGQLGNGTTGSYSEVPVVVLGLSNVRSIAAGAVHTCAVLEDGTARCWGDNRFGQFGDGTNTGSNAPMAVPGLSSVRSIAAGDLHTCAALEDGTARCWGFNFAGELGDGTTIGSTVPVVVSGCEPALSTSNYTECRQVIHFEALTMYSKPCKYATPLKVAIAPCQRFEYLAAAKPQVSDCASEDGLSCWIEVIYNGTRGWIVAGLGASCAGNSLPSDVALVAYCPTCRVQGEHDVFSAPADSMLDLPCSLGCSCLCFCKAVHAAVVLVCSCACN